MMAIIVIIGLILLWSTIFYSAKAKANPFSLWLCKRLGLHKIPFTPLIFDGASQHARCERCGFVGMEDSQGNLF
jgi:hypothetical protein